MTNPEARKQLEAIGKRLRVYLKTKGIGINELGRMSGTSGGQISFILQGRTYGIEKLMNIFECCPDLDNDWLLFGEGRMIKENVIDRSNNKTKILAEDSERYAKTHNIDSLRNKLALVQKKHIDLLDDYSVLLKNVTKQ